MRHKKKNIALGALGRLLFPKILWSRGFTAAWLCCVATILVFDLLWCSQTTFRGLGFAGTYLNAILFGTLLALPALWNLRWLQMLVLLLLDAWMVSNLMYCRTYFNYIPLASYGLVGNVMDFTASIYDSVRWTDIFLPLIALLTPLLMGKRQKRERSAGRGVAYCILLIVSGLASAGVALFHGGFGKHFAYLKNECYFTTTPPVIYTLPGTLIGDAMERTDELTPAQQQAVEQWLKEQDAITASMHPASGASAQTPGALPDSIATPQRDNLVIVFCESLESWPIGKSLEGKELTPNLNAMVADTATWYAPRVLSQVGNGRSIDGQLLVLAGMYPMRDFVYSMRYAFNTFHALPRAMKEQGARTYLLSGDKPATWNQGNVAHSFGIDSLVMENVWDKSDVIGHPARLSDRSLIEQTIAKLRNGQLWKPGEKAYLQLVTYTCHNPFRIPDDKRTISFSGNYNEVFANYLTAVHYTDSALGELIGYLRSRPDWDRTMVVIVGDHEALAGRRQEARQGTTESRMVDNGEFVPLIILNAPSPGLRQQVMGQVDVYSTILEQMGLPYGWRGMGFPASQAPPCALDFQGRPVGDVDSVPEALWQHIKEAPQISDLIIKHNLLKQ